MSNKYLTEEVLNSLMEKVDDIRGFCKENKIPMFISTMTNPSKDEYFSEIIIPSEVGVKEHKTHYITDCFKVFAGYKVSDANEKDSSKLKDSSFSSMELDLETIDF